MHHAEAQILSSWETNAKPWIQAVRQGQIQSRETVTNTAILNVIRQRAPQTLLDVGCGEGWLLRALDLPAHQMLGIDGNTELIQSAREAGGARFKQLLYEAVSYATLQERFDLIVCNFSLLGQASVDQLFQNLPDLLWPGGALVVQTLHPEISEGERSQQDGWCAGHWTGCGPGFSGPCPWYFRSVASWQHLFASQNLTLFQEAPLDPDTQQPVSLILIGEKTRTP